MDPFEFFGPVCATTLVIAVIFGIPFGYAAYIRRLKHIETLKMIEQGMVEAPMTKITKDALRWGIVLAALGIALSLGLYPLAFVFGGAEFPLNFGPWMVIGLLPLFFGLSLVVIHYATQDKEKGEEDQAEEE